MAAKTKKDKEKQIDKPIGQNTKKKTKPKRTGGKDKQYLPNGLTPKQEKFCQIYTEVGSAVEAYIKTYSVTGNSRITAYVAASEMLSTPKISLRIAALREEMRQRSGVTKEMLLDELRKIAFSSAAKFHKTWIDRESFENLTNDEKASIEIIDTKVIKKNIGSRRSPEYVDVEHIKVKTYNKIQAIEVMSKMLGYNAAQQVEATVVNVVVGDE